MKVLAYRVTMALGLALGTSEATYNIKHDFEIYPGPHTSHVAVRFQDYVIPFFSRTLSFQQTKR